MNNLHRSLVISCSVAALAACGPEDLGSPGTSGDINIGDITVNPPAATNAPPPPGTVTPAADCPATGGNAVLNNGTINGSAGSNQSYRVCTLPSVITQNTTLPYIQGVVYELNGRVDVGRDDGPTVDGSDGLTGTRATLTIAPGARIFGRKDVSGGSYLVVQRGSELQANGTQARPIIFTSQQDVEGTTQDASSGQWGGVVLLGRAPVSDCFTGGINPADRTQCQMRVEGIANNIPFFGGNTPTDSSGSLQYVQIRYSGFTLDLGGELQSLTLGGVGTGTVLSFIQSYNSSDDGTEFFGGHVNMDHFIAVGAEDDSIDTDSGVQANVQYALLVQRTGVGDRAIENDSPPDDKGPGTTIPDALPRTLTQIANATIFGDNSVNLINVRGASDLTIANSVLIKPTTTQFCINDNGNTGGGRRSILRFYSNELDCTTNAATAQAIAAGNGDANKFQADTLTGKYLNGDNEMNFTPIFNATALSSFFDVVNYVGAVPRVAAGSMPWTQGWACDSTTVSFNSGMSCRGLPVFS